MHITVIIPTHDRIESLRRTLRSLGENPYPSLSVIVVEDGNPDLRPQVIDVVARFQALPVTLIVNRERYDWPFSMNRALRAAVSDAVFYGADDLEFRPETFAVAAGAMHVCFPDGDGVIGFKQVLHNQKSQDFCDSAFGLMGRKFIERFPDRQVFCPDYIHYYSDSEMGEFSKAAGLFQFCPSAVVDHHRAKDNTWDLAHLVLKRDRQAHAERSKRGLLWGRSFERVQ